MSDSEDELCSQKTVDTSFSFLVSACLTIFLSWPLSCANKPNLCTSTSHHPWHSPAILQLVYLWSLHCPNVASCWYLLCKCVPRNCVSFPVPASWCSVCHPLVFTLQLCVPFFAIWYPRSFYIVTISNADILSYFLCSILVLQTLSTDDGYKY